MNASTPASFRDQTIAATLKHDGIRRRREARREIAERYRKEGEAARREVKRLEKAQAELDKRRAQLK